MKIKLIKKGAIYQLFYISKRGTVYSNGSNKLWRVIYTGIRKYIPSLIQSIKRNRTFNLNKS